MLEATQAYKAAIVGDSRMMLLKAVIEIIDPDITYGSVSSSGAEPFSKPEQVIDKDTAEVSNYVTLESNRWLLGRGFNLIQNNSIPGQVGLASTAISGADGTFSSRPWCQINFTNVSILQACSIYFPTAEVDGVAEDFTVDIYQGGVSYHTATYTGNTLSAIEVTGFTVYDPDAIRVTVSKWSLPGRRMRTVDIWPGIYERWDSDIIAAFDLRQQGDVSCLSLPYGTCTLRMDNLDRRFEPRSKGGVFQSIEERQGIPLMLGPVTENGEELQQVGIFYQHAGGWRTGDNGITISWDLVDIVGLLANRAFIPPAALPTTLSGWIGALAAQLGKNFADRWHVDSNYANRALTCSLADVEGQKCGDILRWVCMATGTWPRADAATGDLTAEPLWNQGNELTLDNLEGYPVMKANDDLAAIIFTLNDGSDTRYVVSGNATASSQTVSVRNPFIKTQAQALTAARQILAAYGGNKLETTGRGDPASEIGDVDTVWLNESSATTGRRIMQTLGFQNGVLRGCKTTLLQADGSFLYEKRAVITKSGTWTAPAGVTSLRLILVGSGTNGTNGTDGDWDYAGVDGVNGQGGKVWSGTVNINAGQSFAVSITASGTVFGAYSSENGQRYPYGFTDVQNGDSFGRSGVPNPLPGSGDGGKAGKGGSAGHKHWELQYENTMAGNLPAGYIEVVDNYPGKGTPGSKGATGCVVIYWEKEG